MNHVGFSRVNSLDTYSCIPNLWNINNYKTITIANIRCLRNFDM